MKPKNLVRGTRIVMGEELETMKRVVRNMKIFLPKGFQEIILPLIEFSDTYTKKAGNEILGQMYVFPDKKGRSLCLRPEATISIQNLLPYVGKDTKLYYMTRCYRYERPQEGRYREFWQFGVEWLKPTDMDQAYRILQHAAITGTRLCGDIEFTENVKRGFHYYKDGKGFEISMPSLGAQKQVCGGGIYEGGCGFAVGVDRLALAMLKKEEK